MLYNEKTYSYTLKLNLAGDKEVKEKLSSVSDYLDEYEKKTTETYVTPFEKAQKTTQFIEGTFRPAILTGVKDIDLLNLSLDRQIIGMVDWGKALGSIIPLLGKVHKEAEKMNGSVTKTEEETDEISKGRLEKWLDRIKNKASKYSDAYKAMMDNVTHIVDVYKSAVKNQIEDLKKELAGIDSQISQTQEKRKEYSMNLLALNNRLSSSESNLAKNSINMTKKQRQEEETRAEKLKADIAAESEAKEALAKKEEELLQEKEEKQKLIAEKEKKARKIELGQSMIKATVNTAEAVTKMLALFFPLNFAMAAVASAMGAVQIGIISRQISKMEDGGLLEGPLHANGGIRIPGTNIEVEGGEYVVNKNSAAQNLALLDYINTSGKAVTASDIAARQGAPAVSTGVPEMPFAKTSSTEERLLAAVEKINLSPVVSVVDIIDAQKNVVSVRDMAGF